VFANVRPISAASSISTDACTSDLELEQESQVGISPPAIWPSRDGSIEVEGLTATYSVDLPPVLKGVTFKILPRVSTTSLSSELPLTHRHHRRRSVFAVEQDQARVPSACRSSDSSSPPLDASSSTALTSIPSSSTTSAAASPSSRKSRLFSLELFDSTSTPSRRTRTRTSGTLSVVSRWRLRSPRLE
jgi:hypothetical protein